MIRTLIAWALRKLLSRYLSAATAEMTVSALFSAYDDVKAKGEKAVVVRPTVLTGPDKPVTIEDITRSENNPV